jgi:hypothetical protein
VFHEVSEAQGGGPAHARHTVYQRLASCRSHLRNKTRFVSERCCYSVLRAAADKSAVQGPDITRQVYIATLRRVRVTTVAVRKQ